jgi:DNA-binding GntR family transcriptional regulator
MPGPPEPTIEYVRSAIREAILLGKLPPGGRVSARALADELGVSHIPVREALRALEGEGQLVRSARRGTFVPGISLEDAEDLYHWRRLVEDEAQRLAVPRADGELIARLRQLCGAMDSAVAHDRREFARLNREFHFAIFDMTGSRYLHHLIEHLWDAEARYHAIAFDAPRVLERANAQHPQIVDIVAARDVEAANHLMEEHRLVTLSAIRASLADSSTASGLGTPP